jgi:sRNA-binding carbon storage regulator CsrA
MLKMGLLCLNREPGQKILIGDSISLTVLDFSDEHDGWATLGVDLPAGQSIRVVAPDGGRTYVEVGVKFDQEMLIGDHIRVVPLRISQYGLRVGVDAPRDIPVDREEVRG